MVALDDVRRVDFGYFVRPAEETGTGQPRVEPCLGYVVTLPGGVLLFDSGMGGGEPEVDAHYRPTRRPLPEALRAIGADVDQVRWVVNCHLHFDHCGGNPLLSGRQIFAQRSELAAARTVDYTLPHLIDFPGAQYEVLDGETELFPDVRVIPTPGHTDGHQSLVARCDDGTIILAGQAHENATAYGADQLAALARREEAAEPLPSYQPWIDRLTGLDPRRVFFAHDQSVWEPA